MQSDITLYFQLYTGQVDAHLLHRALELLDAGEMQRFRKFKATHAGQQYLLGRLLAKTALAEKLGVPAKHCGISLSSNGKPAFAAYPQWHFSIAHCEGVVVVAVAQQEIGVDVEGIARFNRNSVLNEHFFSTAVLANIKRFTEISRKKTGKSPTGDELAALYWTAMEAVVKLEDTSIFSERSRFELLLDDKLYFQFGRDIALVSWQLMTKFCCSVAVKNSELLPLHFRYETPFCERMAPLSIWAHTAELSVVNTDQNLTGLKRT